MTSKQSTGAESQVENKNNLEPDKNPDWEDMNQSPTGLGDEGPSGTGATPVPGSLEEARRP